MAVKIIGNTHCKISGNDRETVIAQLVAMIYEIEKTPFWNKRLYTHRAVEFILSNQWAFDGPDVKPILKSIRNALRRFRDDKSGVLLNKMVSMEM